MKRFGILFGTLFAGWAANAAEPNVFCNGWRFIRGDVPRSFIARANAIAHEEYPGDQCFTAGWKRGYAEAAEDEE